jgi:hypothetical protein
LLGKEVAHRLKAVRFYFSQPVALRTFSGASLAYLEDPCGFLCKNILIMGLPRLFGMKVKKNKDAGLSSGEERLTLNDIWAIFRETDKQIQETSRLLRQSKELTRDLKLKCGKIIGDMNIPDLTTTNLG